MTEFLQFIDGLRHSMAIHVDITYSKTCDWVIYVYRKGCADDPNGAPAQGDDAVMCYVEDCDMELCFAKAHVKLKEWMLEYNDGY